MNERTNERTIGLLIDELESIQRV